MKTVRQVAILDIIEKQEIETQEELASSLNARGIRVTQATVSRDIKELRLLKDPLRQVQIRNGRSGGQQSDRPFHSDAGGIAAVCLVGEQPDCGENLVGFSERRGGSAGQYALAGGAGDAGRRQHGAADYPLERGDDHRHQPHPGNDEITAMVIPGTEKEYPS